MLVRITYKIVWSTPIILPNTKWWIYRWVQRRLLTLESLIFLNVEALVWTSSLIWLNNTVGDNKPYLTMQVSWKCCASFWEKLSNQPVNFFILKIGRLRNAACLTNQKLHGSGEGSIQGLNAAHFHGMVTQNTSRITSNTLISFVQFVLVAFTCPMPPPSKRSWFICIVLGLGAEIVCSWIK